MISTLTRILLIGSASIGFLYVVTQIRNSNFTIRDSIFWVFFSIVLVIIAIFPNIPIRLSKIFGIESPTNFIFIVIIAIMIVRIYRLSVAVSSLITKIKELTQTLAIQEYEISSKNKNDKGKSN